MKKKYFIFVFLIISIIYIVKCEVDHGLYPVDYKITGNIIFFKGEAPANTDRIEVFAIKEFPPDDPQNFLYLGQSGSLNYSSGDTVRYEVRVSPTSYELIGVVWKEKGHDWNLTGIAGLYTGDKMAILPKTVTVSKEIPVVDNIDFYANWKTVSKKSSISGKITYNGNWPNDTQLLLLAVYRVKPQTEFQYIAFENVDYTQPINTDSSTYRISVNSGTYNYVGLFWVGNSIKKLTDLIPIGYYENSNTPGQPGSINVAAADSLINIDLNVNFNEIEFP